MNWTTTRQTILGLAFLLSLLLPMTGIAQLPVPGPNGEKYLGLGYLSRVEYNSSQNALVTGGDLGIYFWDIKTGKLMSHENTFENPYYDFITTHDGLTTIVIGKNMLIKFHKQGYERWTTAEGKDFGNHIYGLTSDDKTLLTSSKSKIKIWDLDNRTEKITLSEQPDFVDSAVLSNKDKYLLVKDFSKFLLYSMETGKLIRTMPSSSSNKIIMSNDEKYFFETTFSGMKLSSIEAGDTIISSTGYVENATFLKNNDLMMVQGGKVNLYQSPNYSVVKTFENKDHRYYDLMESCQDGIVLFFAFGNDLLNHPEERIIDFWDINNNKQVISVKVLDESKSNSTTLQSANLINPTPSLLVDKWGEKVIVYDLETGQTLYKIDGYTSFPSEFNSAVQSAPFSADGNTFFKISDKPIIEIINSVMTVTTNNQINVFDSITNSLLFSYTVKKYISQCDVSLTGRYFAYIAYPDDPSATKFLANIFDLQTGKELYSFKINIDLGTIIHDFIVTPDGNTLLINYLNFSGGSANMTTELWNTQTGKIIRKFTIDQNYSNYNKPLLFTADSKMCLIPSSKEFHLQNIQTGEMVKTFPIAPSSIDSLDMTADSSLIGFLYKNQVVIYRISDMNQVFNYTGSDINFMRFSSDGSYLLVGSSKEGGELKIIELKTGNTIKIIYGYVSSLCTAVFTKDNSNVLLYYYDGNRSVWDISSITNQTRSVLVDDQAVFSGKQFTLPVEIDNADNVIGALLKIKYDSALLHFDSVNGGSLAEHVTPLVNSEEGILTIALSMDTPLAGKGSLVNLVFTPKDAILPGVTSSIQIEKAQLNDDEIPATPRNGTITFFAKGYCWGDLNGDDNDGTLDSSLILQWVVGLTDSFPADVSIKSPSFPVYADLNGDGKVGTIDSSLLLQKKVGLITSYPVDSSKPLNYGPEVSNDLSSKAVKPNNEKTKRTVFLPEMAMADVDGMVTLPLSINDAAGILGYYLQIQYNPSSFEFQSTEKGDLTSNWSNPVVNNVKGILQIAASGVQAINGKGTLAVLRLKTLPAYLNANITSEEIQIIQAELNDGQILAETQNGKIVKSTEIMEWALF